MILITGACGHIGNVLTRELYKQGHTNLRLFVQPNEDISHVKEYACEIVQGDIRDGRAVRKAAKDCETVFHLAGVVTVSNRYRQRVMDINYGGTKNVVAACMAQGAGRLIHVSSTDSLKRLQDGRIDETHEAKPKTLKSVYAQSKAMANAHVFCAAAHGLDAVVVYPSSVLGPHDYQHTLTGGMIKRYLTQGKIQVYFDGRYNFVDVRDAANGMIQAWRKGEQGQGYMLAGNDCSIEDIIEAVQTSVGTRIRKMRVPVFLVYIAAALAPIYSRISGKQPIMSKNAIDVLRADTKVSSDKAAKAFGFSARSLQNTIDDTIAWLRKHEPDSSDMDLGKIQ